MSGLVLFTIAARAEDLPVDGGQFELRFTGQTTAGFEKRARTWIQNSALAVSTYDGAFPVPRAKLVITPSAGNEASNGKAFGWNGPLITIALGREATDATLADDWILVHEMVHLGFPGLADRHDWVVEGLATYVEPFARARAGLLSPENAWAGLFDGLPQGQPESGNRGLDHTHTWGGTYWGGAMFCLLADVEMRRRTGNRFGLEHALRAIIAAGGTIDSSWNIDRVIATGDAAIGAPVLRDLYDEMKDTPVTVDVDALAKRLGIVRRGRRITFDDAAPLAPIRQAISKRQPEATRATSSAPSP